jgi:TRAP-type C4-dicarboxylate transport system substrate-binding protein
MLNCSAILRAVCVAVAVLAASGAAQAQQTIKLTIIDGYPPKALWVKYLIEYFIPEVDKRLAAAGGKHKIDWHQAWSGQIAKPRGVMDALKNKLGDIGVVTTVFYSGKLPLNNLPYYTPFSSRNPVIVSRVMDELADKFPAFQKQFDDQNQVVLTNYSSIDNYGLFTKTPVNKMEDLKGMKLNAAGPNALYLKPLGGVGVLGSLVTYYNQIKTGVTDGAVIWMEAAITFKIAEVAPYYYETDFGTGVNKSIAVNKEIWNGLPDEVKKVLKDTARDYRDQVAKAALAKAGDSMKAFKKQGGKVVTLSDADKKKWADMMPNIALALAEDVEKKNGYPAKEILAAYMQALRKHGEKPVRDWDKK